MVAHNKGGAGEDCLHQISPGTFYMACYKFVPPEGYSVADVLVTAHRLRMAAGAYNIQEAHLTDAIAELTRRKAISITEVVLA